MRKNWRKEYTVGDGLWVIENQFPYLLDLLDYNPAKSSPQNSGLLAGLSLKGRVMVMLHATIFSDDF